VPRDRSESHPAGARTILVGLTCEADTGDASIGTGALSYPCDPCAHSPAGSIAPRCKGIEKRRQNSLLLLILSAFLAIRGNPCGAKITKISWGFSPDSMGNHTTLCRQARLETATCARRTSIAQARGARECGSRSSELELPAMPPPLPSQNAIRSRSTTVSSGPAATATPSASTMTAHRSRSIPASSSTTNKTIPASPRCSIISA
jgi:hypothetical protein